MAGANMKATTSEQPIDQAANDNKYPIDSGSLINSTTTLNMRRADGSRRVMPQEMWEYLRKAEEEEEAREAEQRANVEKTPTSTT